MTKTEFQREERYVVFKLSDVEEHFTSDEKQQLARLVEVQRVGREEAGKAPLECVVVESDWPEYEPTWRAIEARVAGAQPAPSVPEGWKATPVEVVDLYIFMCAAFVPMTPQQEQIALQLDLAKRAMLAAAPEAKL